MQVDIKSKCAGYFQIRTNKRGLIAEFPNLITNGGLDRMATLNFADTCYVGSGTITPANADVVLQTYVGKSVSASTLGAIAQPSAPYYTEQARVYSFAVGGAVGNLSEIGVGWYTAPDEYALFSRARILDGGGLPTTITVLADEQLEVTYILRLTPPTGDFTGTLVVTGDRPGSYPWTMRACEADSSGSWQPYMVRNNIYTATLHDGIMGSGIIIPPTGTVLQNISGWTPVAYVPGTHQISIDFVWGLFSPAFDIKSIYFALGAVTYKLEFSTPIPKAETDVFTLRFSHSWDRA